MNAKLFMALTAMSFLWVGSQIPLYLYGAVLPLIYSDIGGANGQYLWMIIGYAIPVSALCPFVGALSDMFGRKLVACAGQIFLMIGPIVVSTASTMNAAIGESFSYWTMIKKDLMLTYSQSGHGTLWHWCWSQRTDRTGWHIRARSCSQATCLCWLCRCHHPSILPIRHVGLVNFC